MADELRRRTEEILKQFVDLGAFWAEKIVVVNEDGTAVGAGGGGGIEPGDEVALTPATLAALETINAVVSGTVALDAGTLAALESITAVGPLTDAQLRAAAVPIVLDAAALAALESITAVGPLTNTELRASAVPVTESTLDAVVKAEDAASTNGDPGFPVFGVRKDADTTNVGTDGDYALLQVDANGRLKVITASSYLEDAAAASGDRGVFVLAQRHDADTSTVSTDGDYSALHVDSTGKLKVTGGTTPATAGANTSVANAIADGQVLASNSNRKGATLFNDDTATTGATVKVSLGFTASASAYTVAILPQGYYEVPFGYTGEIRRYASAATGNLRVTELT